MASIFISPTAHGWNVLRAAEQNGSWTVLKLQTLEEAAPLLAATDDFVLGLPVSAVLAQRFRLPSADPAEFPEMIRIQIEKLLPFAADEVTTDFELIEQKESESVVSAVAIRNEQLAEMASPLLGAVTSRDKLQCMPHSAQALMPPVAVLFLFIQKARRSFTW